MINLKRPRNIFFLFFLLAGSSYGEAQDSLRGAHDTLLFRGLFSAWLNMNASNTFPLWMGARYIPQLNYNIRLPRERLIDFEGSVNLSAQTGMRFFDTATVSGIISPYRVWARYSTRQFEARLGLQKINFGSATLLRPLMWFDQIDPRDPLQLTNGVYGLLGRYYFLNNANVWLWALHGNEQTKNWEISKTNQKFPELGGRFQSPLPKGETGISYHFRMADTRETGGQFAEVPENRIGLDGKWDVGIGLWFEGAWINKGNNLGAFTNQEIITVGADYTFGIGKGLNLIYEQFLASYDEKAFGFANNITMSAFSLSYPVSMFDNLSALVYYDWVNRNTYNFLNWKRQYRKFYVYLMAYWNPEISLLPQQQGTFNLFSGRGAQVMLVYNH